MARRSRREEDSRRTELLAIDELFVLKGTGDENTFHAWLYDDRPDCCPFCDGAEKNAGTLMRAAAGGDLKLCGLTAHTLKTGLRLLGFTALSLAAARLEEYADTGYEEGLRLLVPDFAAEVSGCGKRLAECLARSSGGNPPGQAESPDPGKLREASLALEECAASGDLRTAGRILGMLAGHGLTEAMRELVTQAGQAARNGDK